MPPQIIMQLLDIGIKLEHNLLATSRVEFPIAKRCVEQTSCNCVVFVFTNSNHFQTVTNLPESDCS